MSILVNKDTKVIVQGITGKTALFHTRQMIEYGTKIVAGVTPGKGGSEVDGIPVFDTLAAAVKATGATVSVIYVPAKFAADSIIEAVEAELELVVCISEHVPVMDMIRVKRFMEGRKTRLIGPNCPGIISAGKCMLGLIPGDIHLNGHIGVVSRSGTLTYEAIKQLTDAGIGQSSAVGIGGDPIKGLDFIEVLQLFNEDEDTLGVLMLGEIGGSAEETAAAWIKANMKKPVAAFIGGRMAPKGKRMGHAGAIISGGKGTADEKIKALRAAGIRVADTPAQLGEVMIETLRENKIYEQCRIK